MAVKAVLFDMDGTLVVSEETHQRALRDVLNRQGVAITDAFLVGLTGLSLKAAYDEVVQVTGLAMPYADLLEAKHAAYLRRRGELQPRPGARQALDYLRSRGIRSAVVSNSDRIIVDTNLAVMGLTQAQQITVSRNDVRHGKPHPEPYLRAAWLLGLEPQECVVVEDSGPGASAGLAAGMQVIAWPEAAMEDFSFPGAAVRAEAGDLLPTLKGILTRGYG